MQHVKDNHFRTCAWKRAIDLPACADHQISTIDSHGDNGLKPTLTLHCAPDILPDLTGNSRMRQTSTARQHVFDNNVEPRGQVARMHQRATLKNHMPAVTSHDLQRDVVVLFPRVFQLLVTQAGKRT